MSASIAMQSPTLEQCLKQWRNWQLEPSASEAPVVARKLNQGKTNQSYLLKTAQHSYVLRIHADSALHSIDRQQEYRIQQAVKKMGLGTSIYYQSPNDSYRVSAFIEGDTVTQLNVLNNDQLVQLCEAIKKLHSVSIDLPIFSYSQQLTRYWQMLNQSTSVTTADISEQASMLSLCLKYENDYGRRRSLCHHDLHGGNIVLSGQGSASKKVIFLDWEFAGFGIPSFDFAALACELALDIVDISRLCGISCNELNRATSVYRYICEVYNRARVC